MFHVCKRLEISAAHSLALGYESKCTGLHGHNWIIDIRCSSRELDENGMVVDFMHIKSMISDALDHRNLNEVLDCNPTAENIALWIARRIGPKCRRVEVRESEGNTAVWEADE